jgi:hypothetical protein
MAVPAEAPLIYAFAALLAVGSIVLLFIPLLRHLSANGAGRSAFAVVLVGLLGLSLAAILAVLIASSNEVYFLPLAAVTVVLRLASPTLLYRGVRDRIEARRSWPVIRILLAVGFVGLALLLAYNLAHVLAGQFPPLAAGLSEQFAMAAGASILIMRTAFRFRPRFALELWPVWLSATAFAIAFIVVAPYAFPAFAAAYVASGLVGWIVAVIVLRYAD